MQKSATLYATLLHVPNSLSPITIGSHIIRNRYVMGSMHTGLEDKPSDIPTLTRYFVERAQGGVGLIITGGYAPNWAGKGSPLSATFSASLAKKHKPLTQAVHQAGSKICLQILHTGRYAYHPFSVAPSRIKAPISPFTPFALPGFWIKKTIADYARTARHAKDAGYDGVEVMGSEGYFIHQFIATRTNRRTDEWGGSFENRIRLALEIVKAIRKECGKDFLIIFRISLLDLVEGGSSPEETLQLAHELEKAGTDIFNSGIGWHEARIPTIATMVPRGAFRSITAEFKKKVSIPVMATNRINVPELAEEIISNNEADFVALARPFLADPNFVNKAATGKAGEINTCIACNQACLDHVFEAKKSSCLVNPKACEEISWEEQFSEAKQKLSELGSKKVAVVGAGPAGLSAALTALEIGHKVTLFEQAARLGGQFNLAAAIPGKHDYFETIRYFENQIKKLGGTILLNTKFEPNNSSFEHVIISTGVKPRNPNIPNHSNGKIKAFAYDEWINKFTLEQDKKNFVAPKGVAIIGTGGIAVDVASAILHLSKPQDYFEHWGIEPGTRSGLSPVAQDQKPTFAIGLFQRSKGVAGRNLGKTTGWAHRLELKKGGVKTFSEVQYHEINEQGLVYSLPNSEKKTFPCEWVIFCAGQEKVDSLGVDLLEQKVPFTIVGGAKLAAELDAKRAIREGAEAALNL